MRASYAPRLFQKAAFTSYPDLLDLICPPPVPQKEGCNGPDMRRSGVIKRPFSGKFMCVAAKF